MRHLSKKEILVIVRDNFVIWCLLSLLASGVKQMEDVHDINNCSNTYPVDYILYTELFCEVSQSE